MPATDDVHLARECADLAGSALLAERLRPGPDVGARGDALAHRLIADRLRAARPDDVILSEEAADDPARLGADRVWIIDPLDGTREYGEPGCPQWAVHVALWTRAAGLDAAAVALPAIGTTLDTGHPPSPATPPGRWRITVSRTRPPAVARRLGAVLDVDLVPLGSAGFKVAAVLLGQAEAYLHAGGQYQWDSAAPVAVARAAGLHATRLDGTELEYNVPELYVPDLLVCRPEWADRLLREIGNATG